MNFMLAEVPTGGLKLVEASASLDSSTLPKYPDTLPRLNPDPELLLIIDERNTDLGEDHQEPYPVNPFEDFNDAYVYLGTETMRSVIEGVRMDTPVPGDDDLRMAHNAVIGVVDTVTSSNPALRRPLGWEGSWREEAWRALSPSHFSDYQRSKGITDPDARKAVQRRLTLEALASVAAAAAPDKATNETEALRSVSLVRVALGIAAFPLLSRSIVNLDRR
jgi:hypothetical protein